MSLNYNRKFQTKFGPKYVLKLLEISYLSKSLKYKNDFRPDGEQFSPKRKKKDGEEFSPKRNEAMEIVSPKKPKEEKCRFLKDNED